MNQINLSASIAGWDKTQHEPLFDSISALGYTGVEILPGEIFPEETWAHLTGAALFAGYLYQSWGLKLSALAGVLEGFPPALAAQDALLEEILGGICRFGAACRCNTLVMPCPPLFESEDLAAVHFLHRCGLLAAQYQCTIALAPAKGQSTKALCRRVKEMGLPGLSVCLDTGALLETGETVAALVEYLPQITHVRISEPDGGCIRPRGMHQELALLLKGLGYQGWVSVVMRQPEPGQTPAMQDALRRLAEVFETI